MTFPPGSPQAIVGWISAGLLGLITGSFLNAVIHRLPRGISLLSPRRSFCPDCRKTIPWHENLPLASWVLLRGRCSGCAMPIPVRYPLVELLTMLLYLAAWREAGLPGAPVLWIFFSLMVAATFIDIDHLIIPDEITLGGTAAGLVCAGLVPSLPGGAVWWEGILRSILGAAAGWLLLYGVVEGGKRAFGVRRIRTETPEPLALAIREGHPVLLQGGETVPLDEFLYRPADRISARMDRLEIGGEIIAPEGGGTLEITPEALSYGGRTWRIDALGSLEPVSGEFREISLPREAMGFGDVKFLACIGAFLGWQGMLFSLFAASITGALAGVAALAVTRGRSGGRIPFGPYLALGAVLWVLAGPRLLGWYAGWLHSEAAFFLLRHGVPV